MLTLWLQRLSPEICDMNPAIKIHILLLVLASAIRVNAQNLQFHYDFRHTLDPANNSRNFPFFSFEYFRQLDTVGTGSFLIKVQGDLRGQRSNMGQVFMQLSQSIKFWQPPWYLYLSYSGGLGVNPDAFGFYIANSYGAGFSHPFQWRGAFLSLAFSFRYNAFERPSYDPQLTFYFGKGFFNYKIFVAGSFVCWTQNRDLGMDFTRELSGKKLAFFGDPQVWVKIYGGISAGSRVNVFYNVISDKNSILFYPTIGLKYQFE
jgi:hypothetical protein